MKLTPIFPGHIKPCADRVGVYQRDYENGLLLYCWWDGRLFSCGIFHIQSVSSWHQSWGASIKQNLPWRGVVTKDGL